MLPQHCLLQQDVPSIVPMYFPWYILLPQTNYRIRRMDPSGSSIATVLGTGTSSGYTDGAASSAVIGQAKGLASHPQGGLIFADRWAHLRNSSVANGHRATSTMRSYYLHACNQVC
jgi:hypothetical protein